MGRIFLNPWAEAVKKKIAISRSTKMTLQPHRFSKHVQQAVAGHFLHHFVAPGEAKRFEHLLRAITPLLYLVPTFVIIILDNDYLVSW
jgi:hypothetical protein